MDHHVFDTVTRLVGTAGSRRTAWRAILGAALFGATTRSTAAAPCPNVRNARCTCGETSNCEPSKCFTHDCGHQFCCTGRWTICGNECCMTETDQGRSIEDPCRVEGSGENRLPNCIRPIPPLPPPDSPCQSGIAGSYRRR